jgi:hypothetical protein
MEEAYVLFNMIVFTAENTYYLSGFYSNKLWIAMACTVSNEIGRTRSYRPHTDENRDYVIISTKATKLLHAEKLELSLLRKEEQLYIRCLSTSNGIKCTCYYDNELLIY